MAQEILLHTERGRDVSISWYCLPPLGLLARDYIPKSHKGGNTLAPLFQLDPVDPSAKEFKDREKEFMKVNLELVKVGEPSKCPSSQQQCKLCCGITPCSVYVTLDGTSCMIYTHGNHTHT